MRTVPGPICLQGGREFTPPCREMDATVLAAAPAGRVAVFAGAARVGSDYAAASERARRHYADLGADVVAVPDPRVDVGAALEALDEPIGLLVLPGGSPSGLRDVLLGATADVGRRVGELHRSGTALSGASAGAMVLCTRMLLPERRAEVASGLGVVDGLALPHWSPGDDRWPIPDTVAAWGLPECGGVLHGVANGPVGLGQGAAALRPAGGTWAPLPRMSADTA